MFFVTDLAAFLIGEYAGKIPLKIYIVGNTKGN